MLKNILERPVFATVISIAIVLLGLLAMRALPTSQFPEVAPSTVNIAIVYPGASADVLVRSTLIPIERAINGVPGMRYIATDATSAGEATVRVIFDPDVDPDDAVVRVKTRVDQVMSLLPSLVQREGVVITPVNPSMLMYLNVYSTDVDADEKFLYNYTNVSIIPELQRIRGVASVQILGSRQYAMRVWLKPDRLRAYNISAQEVLDKMLEQSIIARPGRLGGSSGKMAQSLEYVLIYADRFSKPEQYGGIILRATEDAEIIHLRDVAEVELGSEFFDIYSNIDGRPSAAVVIKQTKNSDANVVIQQVKDLMHEMEEELPKGMKYEVSYDVSSFLTATTDQVLETLRDAFILVSLVVFIFLGNWRMTLIPILAVPVSLVGTFIVLLAFGMSINLITLFGLVLAIGIVVDDAIVIVEAVHENMVEHKMGALEASRTVLRDVGGAIIAITLVMVSVFVPVAFVTGPVGTFYRQFSITMASSIVISALVALTFTPVLCAMILKNPSENGKPESMFDKIINRFNNVFNAIRDKYIVLLTLVSGKRVITIGVVVLFTAATILISALTPSGFIPGEDQGTIYAIIQTPPGSTLELTNSVALELQKIAKSVDGVESVSALAGYEIMTEGRGSNAGTCLINLRPWDEREAGIDEIIAELEQRSHKLGAIIEFFEPPPVPGFGSSGGFSLRLIDKTGNNDYVEMQRANDELMAALGKRKELKGLFSFYASNYPQYRLEINNDAAMQKGVSIGAAMENLNILIGSTYEQGFIRFGRFYKVYVQAAPEYRRFVSDLNDYYVKNDRGEMVPYSSFMTTVKTQGPNEITRFNLYNSAVIRGVPADGYTTGDVIDVIRQVATKTLPRGFDVAWEGLSYDESSKGSDSFWVFVVVIVFVYLVLSAQYESFVLPFSVLLSLPIGICGSFSLLWLLGLANDIYAQVGMVMLIGLLGKNAVLIVEFAVHSEHKGLSSIKAAIEGARARLRPILMTSFAFIVGMIPLVMSTGPGAIGNRTIGASALGGMLVGTIGGVLIIPGLYFIFSQLSTRRKLLPHETETPLSEVLYDQD